MKKIYLSLVILFATVFVATAQTTWKADVAHSKVQFSISHMVISEVTGRFKDFEATLIQTNDDLSDSKLNATIKVNSINTDNEKRDGHLKSADFFDAEKYPEITFVSKSFTKSGNGQVKDPWGNLIVGFKATTTVNRKDFGIVWNKALETGGVLVGEDVSVTIVVEMQKEKK
jgi:polyisoprenoid-binding protein YceI